jgi:hypothetical protein
VKKQVKKLALNKETVRQLEEVNLPDAAAANHTFAHCTEATRVCTLCFTCVPCIP